MNAIVMKLEKKLGETLCGSTNSLKNFFMLFQNSEVKKCIL